MKKTLSILLALALAIGIMIPAEAANRHHQSIGRQIQRTVEKNLVRFVDRSLRAYTDNYINDVYYWHRQHRNERLRRYKDSISRSAPVYHYEIVASSGNSQYAIGGISRQRPMSQDEIAVMQMIATAVQTGRPIQARSNYHRRLIIELAESMGLSVQRGNNFFVYVSE